MIKNVWIEEGCVTCGNSESVCPEVFEIDIEKEGIPTEENNFDVLSATIALLPMPLQIISSLLI